MNDNRKAQIKLICSMLIYGTIGLFRRMLPFSSAMIAIMRGIIGSCFLIVYMKIRKKPIRLKNAANEVPLVLFIGALIGVNWIFLFEAYNYTTVAIATLCYYMAPVFVIIAAVFVLGERMTVKKIISILLSVIGMILISKTGMHPESDTLDIRGILFGLLAAALYAAVILLNKKIKKMGVYERTILQLLSAAFVLIPYQLVTDGIVIQGTPISWGLMIFIGIVHTGIAYLLYFGSLTALPTQTVALFSYIDPVTAVLLSAFLLREPLGLSGVLGTILILGAALINELAVGEHTD
ncbi:MAG: EamA family transporter [Clostridia bacterium]|nr:EamA family transporter [Clostridia bacterium]